MRWKAVKWHGKYFNVYLDGSSEENIVKIMYPPKEQEFTKRHRQLMQSKGYEVIEIRGTTYIYRRNDDKREC